MEGRTNITLLKEDGEPMAPKGVDRTLVNQYGYFVQENIPVSYKLWKKNKVTDNDADIIPDTEKEILWREVKLRFNFPENKEEVLKDWVMKKMAIAFQIFKKNLNKDYVKKGLTPDFENNYKKQHPFWMNSCSISCKRTMRSEQDGTKTIQARRSTSIILAKEVIFWRFRNGRRWKKT
jgi:hypothetical protein